MPNKAAQAGFYILKSFKVKPIIEELINTDAVNNSYSNYVELSKTISHWNMSESIDSPFITGSATIHESSNLLEDVPIRGEEELEITYEDYYGDIKTTKFFIYSVEDIGPESSTNDRMTKYTLRFCSVQKLHSDQKEIRKSWANTKISDMVEDIYNSFFITGNKDYDKEIEVEETDGEQTLVIPNLRPDAAMQFLSRRAYSNRNKSSLYRFFETREKYYFCTHEYLTDKYADFDELTDDARNRLFFIYNTVEDNTGPGQMVAQQSVNNVNYGAKVDTMADMKQGTYRRNITELDINYRTRTTRLYDYIEESEDIKAPEKLKLTHSKEFVNEYMNADIAPETVLITDFPQVGQNEGDANMLKPYQHFYENYSVKPISNYHMAKNAFQIEINGRIGLYPGMILNLELYKFSTTVAATREIDAERSGKFIVTDIVNSFGGDAYKQQVMITKGGLS